MRSTAHWPDECPVPAGTESRTGSRCGKAAHHRGLSCVFADTRVGIFRAAKEALAKQKEKQETLEKEKQAATEARAQRKWKLQGEESNWQRELSQTKGLFFGKRRKEITMKLEEIAAELRKLELIDDAEVLCTHGELKKAAISLGKESIYQYAREHSLALWNDIAKRDSIGAGGYCTIGLKTDGTVVAVGNNIWSMQRL